MLRLYFLINRTWTHFIWNGNSKTLTSSLAFIGKSRILNWKCAWNYRKAEVRCGTHQFLSGCPEESHEQTHGTGRTQPSLGRTHWGHCPLQTVAATSLLQLPRPHIHLHQDTPSDLLFSSEACWKDTKSFLLWALWCVPSAWPGGLSRGAELSWPRWAKSRTHRSDLGHTGVTWGTQEWHGTHRSDMGHTGMTWNTQAWYGTSSLLNTPLQE